VIGEFIRKRQEDFTRKYLMRIFDRPFFRSELSYRQLEKIISVTVKVNQLLLSVVFFLALLTVFFKFILPRLGFEKSVILLLVVMIFLIRSFLEANGRE